MAKLFPNTRETLAVWFVFLIGVILGSAYVANRAYEAVTSEQSRMAMIQSIREDLMSWMSSQRDAETATRGYLLTNGETFLVSFEPSLREAHRAMRELQEMLKADPVLGGQVDELATLGKQKENHLSRLIELRQKGTLDGPTVAAMIAQGKSMMNEIQRIVGQMDATQRERLAASSEVSRVRKERASTVSLLTSGLLLCFVGLFFVSANRSLRERSELLEKEQAARALAQGALTAEKTALDIAEQANQSKDEFLAIVSHELRTPLNAILGWVAVLKGEPIDSADLEAGITTIERNARAQQTLIDELLDVTRIASGKIQLELRKVDLPVVAKSAIESLRPTADLKQVVLHGPAGDEHAIVAGAENRMHQVISNLVGNAIKFTPPGGAVSIWVGQVNSWVEAVVADNGKGIDPQFLPRIFDRFIQLDGSTTRTQGGLGLGLSIVRHLVELQGGSVTAESLGLGHGATFRVRLPLVVGDRTTGPAPDPAAHGYAPLHSASEPSPGEKLAAAAEREPQNSNSTDSIRTTKVTIGEVTTKSPAPEGEKNESGGAGESKPEPSLEGVQLLVVDDHADTLEAMVHLLRGKGAIVRTAERTAAALELLRGWQPDVIISDLGMPTEDGYNLIRRVRGLPDEGQRWVPALALTAFAREDDKEKALAAGFDDYLAKPADPDELIRKIFHLNRVLE